MRTARRVNILIGALGLTLFSIGVFHALSAQAQEDTLTDPEAQRKETQESIGHHHYVLIDIGGFGGPNSSVTYGGITSKVINAHGTVVGNADTTTVTHTAWSQSAVL